MAASKPGKSRRLISDLPGLDRHVLVPLEQAGLTYIDEIEHLPLKRLFGEIVHGPKSQEKLARALNREAEYDLWRGKGDIEVPGLGLLPLGEFRQAVTLRGTARAVLQNPDATVQDLQDGLARGTVSKEDVARYVLGRRNARQAMLQGHAQERAEVAEALPDGRVLVDLPALDSRIDAIIEQYKHDYDTRLWLRSDWDAVRRLAMLEIYVDQAQRVLLSRSGDAVFQYAPQIGALTDQINKTLGQIAKLREEMGVSLRSRAERDRGQEAHEVLTDFISQAKRLVADRASICIHCGIRLGLILPHFPRGLKVEGRVLQQCPRCGEWMEWQLVTPQMLEVYVEAGDFVPEGVGPGVFDRPESERPEWFTHRNNNQEREKYHSAVSI